jgi:hypothetical protein
MQGYIARVDKMEVVREDRRRRTLETGDSGEGNSGKGTCNGGREIGSIGNGRSGGGGGSSAIFYSNL